MDYSIGIVGGGISGLYCALQLSPFYKIILFEKENYLGGRIRTNNDHHFEMGATRFKKNHHLLMALLDRYNLKGQLISNKYSFKSKCSRQNIPQAHLLLKNYLSFIYKKSQHISSQELQKLNFKDFCLKFTPLEYVNYMKAIFGYDSEFEILNAYDALRGFQSEFIQGHYYQLVEGFSKLILLIKNNILENKGIIKLHHQVTSINKREGLFILNTNKNFTCKCQQIIMAINPSQLYQFPLLKQVSITLKKYIMSKSLLKIVAQYKIDNGKVWFSNLGKITTDSILRQIIPLDQKTGCILVSYTDGKDTLPFLENNSLKTTSQIKKIIEKELKQLFPHLQIPSPIKILSYYWPIGCHYWKAGADSEKISQKFINPNKNIYLCGEFLSRKQTWIEGALEVSNDVIQLLTT